MTTPTTTTMRLQKNNNRSPWNGLSTRCCLLLILWVTFTCSSCSCGAFLLGPTATKTQKQQHRPSHGSWKLYYNDDEHTTPDPNKQQQKSKNNSKRSIAPQDSTDTNSGSRSLERLSLAGVSISAQPPGFFVLLQAAQQGSYLPLAITLDPQDAYATTSPESLTLVQLLSNVDMAGAILPPETLAKLVVLSCESVPELFLEEPQRQVLEAVHASLRKVKAGMSTSASTTSRSNDAASSDNDDTSNELDESISYADAHPWLQSRVQLPQVTLDELVLSYEGKGDDETKDSVRASLSSPSSWQCTLKCKVKSISGTISVRATPELIQAVSYNYDERGSSALFIGIALALRYKSPIVLQQRQQQQQQQKAPIEECEENTTGGGTTITIPFVPDAATLDELFPQRTTVAKLHQSSKRVTQNIEKGFEIHKLTKALEIARRLGDTKAEAKIRAELDKRDSFQELPTTPTTFMADGSNQDPLLSSSVDNEGAPRSADEDEPMSFQ